jgi:hypothetical protein
LLKRLGSFVANETEKNTFPHILIIASSLSPRMT